MALKLESVLLAQVFNALWDHVKEKGEFVKPNHPQLGNIFSADTYQLGDVKALMTDEGYGRSIIIPDKLNVYMFFGGDPENSHILNFVIGDEDALREAVSAAALNIIEKRAEALVDAKKVPNAILQALSVHEDACARRLWQVVSTREALIKEIKKLIK